MYDTCIPHMNYPHQSATQTNNSQHLKKSIKNISFHNLCLSRHYSYETALTECKNENKTYIRYVGINILFLNKELFIV